jgi:glycosyltransferase involved in cell wall biosynthesis
VSTQREVAGDSIHFSGASTSVYTIDGRIQPAIGTTVFDGVEMEKYTFQPNVAEDAPLLFVGRITPVKGPHTAIAVAKTAGRRLILAGNREVSAAILSTIEREIAPHVDGSQIQYVGSVDDGQKNALMGNAAAVLFPTAFKEAFGIVMAEAFACGTPVLASPRGSVPEVVEDGLTGSSATVVSEFVSALRRLPSLDRAAIHRRCARKDSSSAIIVEQCEALCLKMIAKVTRPLAPAVHAET